MNPNIARIPSERSPLTFASVLASSIIFTACTLGLSGAAFADLINIPAVTFVPRDINDAFKSTTGQETEGDLNKAGGRYYAPVNFPTTGKVCWMSLIYRDNDPSSSVTARLMRKRFGIGQSPFASPFQMAILQTNNDDPATQRLIEPSIAAPQIDYFNSFYYVELNVPSQNLQVLGVQVNFRETGACKL